MIRYCEGTTEVPPFEQTISAGLDQIVKVFNDCPGIPFLAFQLVIDAMQKLDMAAQIYSGKNEVVKIQKSEEAVSGWRSVRRRGDRYGKLIENEKKDLYKQEIERIARIARMLFADYGIEFDNLEDGIKDAICSMVLGLSNQIVFLLGK